MRPARTPSPRSPGAAWRCRHEPHAAQRPAGISPPPAGNDSTGSPSPTSPEPHGRQLPGPRLARGGGARPAPGGPRVKARPGGGLAVMPCRTSLHDYSDSPGRAGRLSEAVARRSLPGAGKERQPCGQSPDRGQLEIFGNDGMLSYSDNVSFDSSAGSQGIRLFAEAAACGSSPSNSTAWDRPGEPASQPWKATSAPTGKRWADRGRTRRAVSVVRTPGMPST